MNSCKIVAIILLTGSINLAFIQNTLAQSLLANPLEVEIDKSDPVIPFGYQRRKLSAFEINRIKREMVKLDRTAKAELQEGRGDNAFKLWYRQLKLARAVDVETEIEALGKVGEIAWLNNRGQDLRNIANRAIAIESELKSELSYDLLTTFATAYQQFRYLPQALSIWERIVADSRQKSDLIAIEENLQTLGRLYLSQFDYLPAAEVYEELLAKAQAKSHTDPQIYSYLETLIDIYDRTGQKERVIDTRQYLVTAYADAGKQNKLAQLKLAIADDHSALNQIGKAVELYEEAYTLATENNQLAIAENALDSLGKLYQQEEKPKLAIATFSKLLELQRQSYNHYGLINTYDLLGKIYLRLSHNQRAKQSFKEALKLAQGLNYKVNYFSDQIKDL